MHDRWQNEPDIFVATVSGATVPIKAFRERIRQLAKRRGDRDAGGQLGHHQSVLRDIRLTPDGTVLMFDAVVFSNVDLSSRDDPFPLEFHRFDASVAIRLLAVWLRLPGLEKVSGSRGEGGWHVFLESTLRKRDTQKGDQSSIGAMSMETARLVFERVAQWYHQEHGVQLTFSGPLPDGVLLDELRTKLRAERRQARSSNLSDEPPIP